MNHVGSLDWARRTGGRLSPRDQLSVAALGMRWQMATAGDRVAVRLGVGRDALGRIDFGALRPPDSAAARDAERVCDELPAVVRQHSYRSYLWAVALASARKLSYDEEMVYCSALLHDAGLAEAVEKGDDTCFTLRSADVAAKTAEAASWSPARSQRMQEAITLHLNPIVPESAAGVDAHVVASGIACDVVGAYLWRVHPDTVAAVVERHPRTQFKRDFLGLLKAHAKHVPRGRPGFLMRAAGFSLLVKRAPFDE